MKLTAIDGLIIAAYMSVIADVAVRSRKFAAKNLENYFLGGRNMPGWMTGLSYADSMMSADSAVAYGGLAVSVLRPGTFLMCAAFTSRSSNCPSSTFQIGFQ
jgi:solute:Na+ symporter, SSS family